MATTYSGGRPQIISKLAVENQRPMNDSCLLPNFSDQQAHQALLSLYGIDGTLHKLNGERDLNYKVVSNQGTYVFKIANHAEQLDMLECQHLLFERLSQTSSDQPEPLETARSVNSINGKPVETLESERGLIHGCRLLTWVEGQLFSEVTPHSLELLHSLGATLAQLNRQLLDFRHPAINRPLLWDMANVTNLLEQYIPLVKGDKNRRLLQRFSQRYQSRAVPVIEQYSGVEQGLRLGTIHNDANDNNILIGPSPDLDQDPGPWNLRVRSIIDFGDMLQSWLVVDPAVAAAYAMLGKSTPLDAAVEVVAGYHQVNPLTPVEISLLYDFICLRLCMSVSICAHQQQLEPDNEYLRISEQPAWELLRKLDQIHPDFAHYCFRHACQLTPLPQTSKVTRWLFDNQTSFKPIIDTNLRSEPLLILDTSVSNPNIPEPGMPFDTNSANQFIFNQLESRKTRVAVGKYDEYRLLYNSDDFVDFTGHQRRLHLGIDLYQVAGSSVYAPMAAEIYSIANHTDEYDYGGTLILRHPILVDGESLEFFSLFGHMDPASIAHHRTGDQINAGQKLAEMGQTQENGNWPPHLHYQLMTDMLDETNTFFGVGSHRYRDIWLGLCPDPNLVLGIPAKYLQRQERSDRQLLQHRERQLGPSLSVSYRQPIQMSRGCMQYMFDGTGRRYLDAVNNVPHVGHCHPGVVFAITNQSRVLNTNSRYLYSEMEAYVERLLSLFPNPLSVCYLVNSGSEANDLALRLAKSYTGRHHCLVLDHAYHGNLSSLIDVSPYKHNGPGGAGTPEHVRVIPMPDSYRDKKGTDYAGSITSALKDMEPALFIAESLIGCGGQMPLPDGYLKEAYRQVRGQGALCIADEVQVGFGRVGSHFWGFETQEVVPDIVTLGKPMGNGHPLAAVITTREIADAFDPGMEYFNTYGGNPVSCAAGNAVLEVIETEGLQQNALSTGQHLINGLRDLQRSFPIIGDVRGRGLYLGAELVNSANEKTPAAAQAGYICERMKQLGVLISTDGPNHNVLKIKPPLCFNQKNSQCLLDRLSEVLQETFSKPKVETS